MSGKRFPVPLIVGSKFEILALVVSVENGTAGICGKRFRPMKNGEKKTYP